MSFANVSWLQETKNGTLCFVSVERDDYTLNVCSARLCCRGKRNEASWFPINYRLKKNNSYLQIFWSIFHLISRMPSPVNQAQIRKTLQGCVSRWQWQHSSINHHRNTQIIIDDNCMMKTTSAQAHQPNYPMFRSTHIHSSFSACILIILCNGAYEIMFTTADGLLCF